MPPPSRARSLSITPVRMSGAKNARPRAATVDSGNVGAVNACDSPIELFTGVGDWLPPIIDTGAVGPFIAQPGDWKCGCDYTVRSSRSLQG